MGQVRRRLHDLDPDLPLADVGTMRERLSESLARPRYWAVLVGVFAALGLLLAAVGIYGVLSYFVSGQARDIGIRMALGADASSVRRMVIRKGMIQALLGLGAGLAATLFLTRGLESLLFEISATDPLALALACVVLLGTALAACYWPARRATRLDPVRVLAEE
jgi:putative ABC transport system permease protein